MTCRAQDFKWEEVRVKKWENKTNCLNVLISIEAFSLAADTLVAVFLPPMVVALPLIMELGRRAGGFVGPPLPTVNLEAALLRSLLVSGREELESPFSSFFFLASPWPCSRSTEASLLVEAEGAGSREGVGPGSLDRVGMEDILSEESFVRSQFSLPLVNPCFALVARFIQGCVNLSKNVIGMRYYFKMFVWHISG